MMYDSRMETFLITLTAIAQYDGGLKAQYVRKVYDHLFTNVAEVTDLAGGIIAVGDDTYSGDPLVYEYLPGLFLAMAIYGLDHDSNDVPINRSHLKHLPDYQVMESVLDKTDTVEKAIDEFFDMEWCPTERQSKLVSLSVSVWDQANPTLRSIILDGIPDEEYEMSFYQLPMYARFAMYKKVSETNCYKTQC